MHELVKFECPRCKRPYELNLDLAAAKQRGQRAKCARCGERFEIAARVEAMRVGAVEAPAERDNTGAGLGPGISEVRNAVATSKAERMVDARAESDSQPKDFGGEGPPTVADGAGASALSEAARIGTVEEEIAIGPEDVVEEEESPEAALPEPLDWLASAGTGLEILNRELSERERDLIELITN